MLLLHASRTAHVLNPPLSPTFPQELKKQMKAAPAAAAAAGGGEAAPKPKPQNKRKAPPSSAGGGKRGKGAAGGLDGGCLGFRTVMGEYSLTIPPLGLLPTNSTCHLPIPPARAGKTVQAAQEEEQEEEAMEAEPAAEDEEVDAEAERMVRRCCLQ